MDPRLLKHFNRELAHLREVGGEFAEEYPKIAGRLGLDAFECADPYVERLLEGFAFLAGRVQLEIEAQFPRFTRHLLEMVYPHYLAPTPSMAVVHLEPQQGGSGLEDGQTIPRDTSLRGQLPRGEQTPCIYRTAHPVTVWPIDLVEADYLNRSYSPISIPASIPNVRSVLRLRFQTNSGAKFNKLPINGLPIFLRADGDQAMRMYEQLLSDAVAVLIHNPNDEDSKKVILGPDSIKRVGFDDDQALFPYPTASFQGYRLLHEYFALPERFMFVELTGLKRGAEQCERELELLVLLDRVDTRLENVVQRSDFELYCAPAINLFPRRADRIHLTARTEDYHVLPDRTRPMDFEVYAITELIGHGTGSDSEREFVPFYSLNDATLSGERAYFTVRRVPRLLSSKQKRQGPRSSYIGSEVFVSLVDSREAPFSHDLRQLGPKTMCTNRDLPLHMPTGGTGQTDFSLEISAPVQAVRCMAGPTKPRPSLSYTEGESAWRLINHLSLNYLSLADNSDREGAASLRELLRLYSNDREPAVQKQIEGIRSLQSQAQVRRLPVPGPIVFGRALEISVEFDESGFEGTGIFLLGAVLDSFFAKYVSINSMTETVIRSTDRGEVMRWPVRTGKRHTF
jgi:type VI secretion system protein ImpG